MHRSKINSEDKDLGVIDFSQRQSIDPIIEQALVLSTNNVFHRHHEYNFTQDNITYRFRLNNTLLKTSSESHPGKIKFWIIDDDAEPLGNGITGIVMRIKGALISQNKKLTFKPLIDKVVKIIEFAKMKFGNPSIGMFEEEVRKTKHLPDVNIKLPIMDSRTNTFYMVMDLIPGDTFLDRFAQHFPWYKKKNLNDPNINLLTRLKIFLNLCYSVKRLHQKGIIHRDLKNKKNILLKLDGNRNLEKVSILDLGEAKLFGEINPHDNKPFDVREDIEHIMNLMYSIIFDNKGSGSLKAEVARISEQFRSFFTKYYITARSEICIPDNTITIEQLIDRIEDEKFRLEHPEDIDRSLSNANHQARLAKNNLIVLAGSFTSKSCPKEDKNNDQLLDVDYLQQAILSKIEKLILIKEIIIHHISKVEDKKHCLDEFVSSLDMQFTQAIEYNTKEELISAVQQNINSIRQAMQDNFAKLVSLYHELNKLKIHNDAQADIAQLIKDIEVLFQRHTNYDLTVVNLKNLNEEFQKFIKKNQVILNEIQEKSKKAQREQLILANTSQNISSNDKPNDNGVSVTENNVLEERPYESIYQKVEHELERRLLAAKKYIDKWQNEVNVPVGINTWRQISFCLANNKHETDPIKKITALYKTLYLEGKLLNQLMNFEFIGVGNPLRAINYGLLNLRKPSHSRFIYDEPVRAAAYLGMHQAKIELFKSFAMFEFRKTTDKGLFFWRRQEINSLLLENMINIILEAENGLKVIENFRFSNNVIKKTYQNLYESLVQLLLCEDKNTHNPADVKALKAIIAKLEHIVRDDPHVKLKKPVQTQNYQARSCLDSRG